MSENITIEQLLKHFRTRLGIKLLGGEQGLERSINRSDTHRPALALTGFVELFSFDQVQVLGNTEMEYLRSLSRQRRRQALEIIFQFDIPCVVLTGRGRLLPDIKDLFDGYGVPLLRSQFDTHRFAHLLHFYLDDLFAPQITVHGTLVDVNGIGLLFSGRSGIGKSEVGLDLMERGHRLVADDSVIIARKAQGILVGWSPKALQDHIEIRGIGIVDIKRMYGVRATRLQKRVEVAVKLIDYDDSLEYERIGLDYTTRTILEMEVPEITVPLFPGKNITVISETIALNHLLRLEGYNAAREFNKRLIRSMQE